MTDEKADRPKGDPVPPITASGDMTLPAATASGRACVTKKTAVWWGVLVAALASAATGVTALVDVWGLDIVVPAWYGIVLGFAVGALVAYFVPTRKQVVLSFGLATVLSVTSACASSRDEESVKEVVRLFQEDFNNGAFTEAPNYTTDDWEHIHSGGGITRGRAEVLRDVRSVHQTFLKGVSMTIDSMTIRYLTADVAIVDAVHTVSPHRSEGGDMHINEQWLKTYVIVKKDGKWLLAHDHSTTIEGSMKVEPPT